MRLVITTLILAAALAGQVRAEPASLERRIYQSFLDGDYTRAAELIGLHLEQHPNDPVMLYNAACAHCHLGQNEHAVSFLRRAVEAGLQDLGQITRDPDLEPIRDHPIYRAIVAQLQRAANGGAAVALEQWRSVFGDRDYRYHRDETRGIAYAIALDRTSHRQMRRMIERQTDELHGSLFELSPQSYLLIAVPTPGDGQRLFPNDQTGGIYEHDKRRLIARDIGSSLRHELVHALHYAHMDLLHQRHPLWAQEGLATLYEDYLLADGLSIEFLPNDRHNIVKALENAGLLTSWSGLFRLTDDEFMTKASRLYPQVRSMFEFLADRGLLTCWYAALIEHSTDDPTGARAFEVCFDMPVEDVERAWHRWLDQRPALDIAIDVGDAALGIETELHSSNDGVLITRFPPGSAAALTSLAVGDVIVSADGTPTRSLAELRSIIATRKVGDLVQLRARRNGNYFTVVVTLRPLSR